MFDWCYYYVLKCWEPQKDAIKCLLCHTETLMEKQKLFFIKGKVRGRYRDRKRSKGLLPLQEES